MPRLAHEPALDGLRGLAVAAVVLFHLDRLDGGFLGVDLFFVLSGFLITSLLLTERRHRGRIDLSRFWVRRARRLLPALFLVLAGVAVLIVLFTPEEQRSLFRGDALATLGYVANWHRMGAELSYWEMFSQPSPLDHSWSLAIEEQFYLFWPLVVVTAGLLASRIDRAWCNPRWVVAATAVAGAGASFALLARLYDPTSTNRAYFGTDTRIGATLLGAALAAVLLNRPQRAARPRWWVDCLAVMALGWIGWSLATVDGLSSWYYRGGLALFSLAAVTLVLTVTGRPSAPGLVSGMLATPPLRALGVVSYGVYLWHWPLIVYMDPERISWMPQPGLRLDVLRIAATLAIATASYFLVELPIRQGQVQPRRLLLASAGAVPVLVAVILVSTTGTGGSEQASAAGGIAPQEQDQVELIPDASEFPAGAPRVLMLGDSGAGVLGPTFSEYGNNQGVMAALQSDPVCTIVYPEGVTLHDSGEVSDYGPCQDERRDRWYDLTEDLEADVVVYYLANAAMVRYHLDGEWVDDCDDAYRDYLRSALIDEINGLHDRGARVVLTTTPYVASLDASKAERTDCRNQVYREVVEEAPATLVDLQAYIDEIAAEHGAEAILADWIHLSPRGAELVSEWLLPQLTNPEPAA